MPQEDDQLEDQLFVLEPDPDLESVLAMMGSSLIRKGSEDVPQHFKGTCEKYLSSSLMGGKRGSKEQ